MATRAIQREILERSLSALLERVERTLESTESTFPYFADPDTGTWETTPDGNWCGGHWIGLLRLAGAHADSAETARKFHRAASEHTETMYEYMPLDSMFCGMNFHYAGFRGFDETGDRSLFAIGLEGADAMVSNYNENARQIPLGNLAIKGPEQFRGPDSDHGPPGESLGAVDNLYTTLPVLWRAYHHTGKTVFRDVAISHADRHLDWFLRDDGSTWHHAVFDQDTGELLRQYNELARSNDSCWARGQGWNIAGLARAYTETRASRYLTALQKSVRYHRENTPPNEVPYWDYGVDADEPRDTSTAAIIAYSLSRLPEDGETFELRTYGQEILNSLLSEYLVMDPDAANYGAVVKGCFNRPGRYADDNELIWTNYYVASVVADLLNV